MSAAEKGKARCQLTNSNGEEFTAVFNGVPGKGLTFVLQELRSKDYLGNKEGVLSKSPYHWHINPDENGNLSGEWILRFDEDVKSVIAYSHQTFVITLYDADKKELAKQRVAYSNFGTGLKKTFPAGSKPGAYLQRIDGNEEKIKNKVFVDDLGVVSDIEEKNNTEYHDLLKNKLIDFDDIDRKENASEKDNDFIIEKLQDADNKQKDHLVNDNLIRIHEHEEQLESELVKSIDDSLANNDGYIEESGITLMLILGFIKFVMIPFVIIAIIVVIFMIVK